MTTYRIYSPSTAHGIKYTPAYIFMLLALPLLIVTSACGSKDKTTTADSIVSVEYINNISITNPEKALSILDSAERHQLMDRFDINRLRCLSYHNGLSDYKKALHYGLEAYNMPEARNKADLFLGLVELIADECYQNGDFTQSVRFCTEGLKMAKDSMLTVAEANLSVTLAINLLGLDRVDQAFSYFNNAVAILDKESRQSDKYMATDDYIYSLGMTINSLCDEGRYDEAIDFLPRYEEAVNRLATKQNLPEGLADMRRASGYAAFAYIYALNGEPDKAAAMYNNLCDTRYSQVPEDRGALHVPYLLAAKRYEEASILLKEEKRLWKETADTISREYIDCHLLREKEAYEGLGNIREANRVLNTILTLNDTLRRRDRNDKALELAEIYKTNEQALQIERQSASIVMRNVIITASAIILIICILFIIRIVRYNRTITAKNRAMVKTIDDLMTFKDRVFEQQKEILALRKHISELSEADSVTSENSATDVKQAETEQNDGETTPNDYDRRLFDRMNHEILSRKLFLNPDFSRNSLLAEYRIPAYRFSSFFKDYAGCSFSQYILNCRLDYAVRLIHENPSWSMDAIAKAAQMSNSSFYSQFKKTFGMSPSEFRAADNKKVSGED